MKNYFSLTLGLIKRALIADYVNLTLFSGGLAVFGFSYLLWKSHLEELDITILSPNGIYPVKYLAVIFGLNLLLALLSYDKEKEISYLLLSGTVFVGILILVLEIFYLTHLN